LVVWQVIALEILFQHFDEFKVNEK